MTTLAEKLVSLNADASERQMREIVVSHFGNGILYATLVSRFLAGAISNEAVPTIQDFADFVVRVAREANV